MPHVTLANEKMRTGIFSAKSRQEVPRELHLHENPAAGEGHQKTAESDELEMKKFGNLYLFKVGQNSDSKVA